jgi:hypothetical protein
VAQYCFYCPTCGTKYTVSQRMAPYCIQCLNGTIRDYRAENVVANTAALARERGGKDLDWFKRTFLPTADEFKGPDDPDGSKGLRKWNDEHGPRSDNHNPARPDVPKAVF